MKAVGASGRESRELRGGDGKWIRMRGRGMALQKMTKRHIVKSCWAIRHFVLSTTLTPPAFRSGLFVLPRKCVSFKTCHSNISPSRSHLKLLQLFTAFRKSFIAFLTILASFHFFLLVIRSCLFVHRNNLSFLFYFVANFAWQRGRCWLCRECYVEGAFCEWI